MKTIVRCGLFSLHDDNLIKSIDYKMAKSKGSDSIQIVNLSNLPKTKNSKYDWKNSVGCCIPYYSKNDCGTLQILDYKYDNKIEKSYLLVQCGDIEKWVNPDVIRKACIGGITGNTKWTLYITLEI